MDASNYQKLASRTINRDIGAIEKEYHAVWGMCSEIGELQGIYQKELQGHMFDEEHAKKEVGDLLWFIAEYCTIMKWDLSEVMDTNIQKLLSRYPKGFDEKKSLHRKKGDI